VQTVYCLTLWRTGLLGSTTTSLSRCLDTRPRRRSTSREPVACFHARPTWVTPRTDVQRRWIRIKRPSRKRQGSIVPSKRTGKGSVCVPRCDACVRGVGPLPSPPPGSLWACEPDDPDVDWPRSWHVILSLSKSSSWGDSQHKNSGSQRRNSAAGLVNPLLITLLTMCNVVQTPGGSVSALYCSV
jgi:hypothetical protein